MLLKTHTLHICDINLHVEGLSTGYSQDVHGEVSNDTVDVDDTTPIIY